MLKMIKTSLPMLFRSGWTLFTLFMLSLMVCSQSDASERMFLVWWLSASGVVLIAISIFLDGHADREVQSHRKKVFRWCGWIVFVGALSCFAATNLFAISWVWIVMYISGSLCGVMFINWVKHRELLKWIR
ncbi:hypothetical protein STW0522KLE44_42180 [Klebsiella sp. STW0522-44]|nr:hypothetical protein STW0522KLE44_42180 [Klebsiella sp. STW0522-44]